MKEQYYLITKHGDDDYSVWVTDDLKDESQGSSARGTLEDLKKELAELLPQEV